MEIPPLNLQLIYERGRPTRAIIDIAALEALLDAADDLDDIEHLNSLKDEELEFVSFEDYLQESGLRTASSEEHDDGEELCDRHREAG